MRELPDSPTLFNKLVVRVLSKTFNKSPHIFMLAFSLVIVTCANPDTFSKAQRNPEQYDLIRVRTGGWSEFYIAFFTAHQKHQERRMYYHTT